MFGIAFKLLNFAGDLVDIGEQPAGGFAVKASGGNERIVTLLSFWPRAGIKLSPVVPAFLWWKSGQVTAAWAGVEGLAAGDGFVAGGAYPFIRFLYHHTSLPVEGSLFLFQILSIQ